MLSCFGTLLHDGIKISVSGKFEGHTRLPLYLSTLVLYHTYVPLLVLSSIDQASNHVLWHSPSGPVPSLPYYLFGTELSPNTAIQNQASLQPHPLASEFSFIMLVVQIG